MEMLSYKANHQEMMVLKNWGFKFDNIEDHDQLISLTTHKCHFELILLFDDHQLTMREMITMKHNTHAYILFFSNDYERLYRLIYMVSGAYERYLTETLLALYLRDFYFEKWMPQSIQIPSDQSYLQLPLQEIYYIQMNQRTFTIYTIKGQVDISRFHFIAQMRQLENFSFSNAGNSTFVNLHYVSSVKYSRVMTSFGMKFSLTRRFNSSFKHDYERYVRMLDKRGLKMGKKAGSEL